MGGFYGSIQFRSDDRDAVLRLAEAMFAERGSRFLCGPALGGWIGLYPSQNGQDETLASTLAERWPGEIFYLLVHDGDLFVYRYFRAGKLLDAYWSRPGYFGESDRDAQQRDAGSPDAYAHLIVGKIERVKTLLDRSKRGSPMELERLLEFAKQLGIYNAGTSYEYLEEEERDGIRGWRQFVHVPDRTPARNAARRARAARGVEHKQLTAAGLLLEALRIKPLGAVAFFRNPPVVDFRGRSIRFDEAEDRRAESAHGAWVAAKGDSIEAGSGGSPARSLLVGTESALDARRKDPSLGLFMLASWLTEVEPGRALAALLHHVPTELRATAEAHLRRVLPPPPWNREQATALAQLVAGLAATSGSAGRVFLSRDGSWVVCWGSGLRVAAWSDVLACPDGSPAPWRHQFHVPPHELVPNPRHGGISAAFHDPANDLVVFAGIDGRVRTMSLADGHVEDLLELREREPVVGMKLLDASTLAIQSEPGFPSSRRGNRGVERWVTVWDYPALLERLRSGAGPSDPPLPPHALVPLSPEAEAPLSPLQPVVDALRAAHEKSPRTITLERAGDIDWPDAESRQRLVDPLHEAGFTAGEPIVVPALGDVYLQFFAHEQERIVGTLSKTPQQATTLTLSRVNDDGSSHAYTTTPWNGLDVRPGRVVRNAAGADARTLLQLVRRRAEGAWLSLSVDDLPTRYADNYARQRAWREERGFSLAEAAHFVAARSQSIHLGKGPGPRR